MIEEIALEEKARRFNDALDRLQRAVEAGGAAPHETFAEFLAAADDYCARGNRGTQHYAGRFRRKERGDDHHLRYAHAESPMIQPAPQPDHGESE